ncbi:unnamed protein product [Ectocarpus fasciculatus]
MRVISRLRVFGLGVVGLSSASGDDAGVSSRRIRRAEESLPSIELEVLPQCYSTPEANPFNGSWRRCENGVNESPTNPDDMMNPGPKTICYQTWAEHHGSEEPMPYYTWDAAECSLDDVDEEKFCRVMEGRKGILLVGERVSCASDYHVVRTLVSVLRATSEPIHSKYQLHHARKWGACNGEVKIAFYRSDFLDTTTWRNAFLDGLCDLRNPKRGAKCDVFADDETLKEYDTVIINSGAHPRSLDEYRETMETASKELTASMKRLHGDDALLIVRNTPPGHGGCTERTFDGPVDVETALDLVSSGPHSYLWDRFPEYNAILEEAFLGNATDGWIELDAYTPTLLRPDYHLGGDESPDCLHYCIPGPIDHWVRLLYNMLLAEGYQ